VSKLKKEIYNDGYESKLNSQKNYEQIKLGDCLLI